MIQYYSDRRVIGWGAEEDFLDHINAQKPKYMILSAIEISPDWAYPWPDNNKNIVMPVMAYYFDPEKTQPILVIYQFIYS